MTIGMTARQGKRWGLSALAATVCWIGGPAAAFAGDGPGAFGRKPQGPIFKTLDAFAGGIELVLEKTVLSSGKGKRGCDSQSCDDGCDAITLHQLDMHRGGQMAVPKTHYPSPTVKPSMPSVSDPSLPRMIEVEPTFDRPVRKTLPQPAQESTPLEVPKMPPPPLAKTQSPKAAPPALPQVPVDTQMFPVQKQMPQPNLSSDDSWIDSFAPSTPNRNTPPPRGQAPAADDILLDPFADDPQTRAVPQRFSPTARPSVISESTRPQVRKPVKAAGFVRPK